MFQLSFLQFAITNCLLNPAGVATAKLQLQLEKQIICDNEKIIYSLSQWQGILAGHLWSCRALLTGSWGLLRPCWSLLERSWGPLGASWPPLGRSWALLGTSWDVLKAIQNVTKITPPKTHTSEPKAVHTMANFGPPKGPQNGPKSDPRRVQN